MLPTPTPPQPPLPLQDLPDSQHPPEDVQTVEGEKVDENGYVSDEGDCRLQISVTERATIEDSLLNSGEPMCSLPSDMLVAILSNVPIYFYVPLALSCKSLYIRMMKEIGLEHIILYFSIISHPDPYKRFIDKKYRFSSTLFMDLPYGLEIAISLTLQLPPASKPYKLSLLKVLLGHRGFDKAFLRTASMIEVASEHGDVETLNFLICSGFEVPRNSYLLCNRCASGDVECVRFILEKDLVDPTLDNNLALQKALQNGHTPIVAILQQAITNHPTSSPSTQPTTPNDKQ